MKDNYYLDIILKGYEESLRAIQFEETFATFESHSTVLNMGSTKYSDAEFYQIWINSDPIKTLIARIGIDEFISNEAKSRVQVEAWGILANYFDRQQKITEREYFITNTEFFKNCLNTIDTLILNLKKINGNTESIFYYEGIQGSLTDSVGKGFPYCNEINSFIFIRWHIKNTLKNAYKIEQDLLTPQKPQQTNSIKTNLETKGILTNETYFTILENCTIEAFESLKLKELYPKNGAKAIWDVSTLTITKGDGLPTERDNELFRKEYILDNMRVTFLMALDRFCTDFEIKHSITRDFFYKKCYQSILLKASQSQLWNEPDFGFDIDKAPCKLTFIWNMKSYIEARSIEPKATIKQNKTLDLSNTSTIEKPSFKNIFDNVNEKDIIEYFTKNLVEKRHLTKETLTEYLKQAFELKTPPKQKFSFKSISTKENIVSIFYKYYKETAGKPYGKQQQYLDLLKIYFNGFEKINIRNFSK